MKGTTKAVTVITAVAVIAILAAAAWALMPDNGSEDTGDTYSIEYVLNGGVQNPLNPSTYTAGVETVLHDATDDTRVFVSWYLDEGLTQPCTSITSEMSGDITLYAGWSDTLVGKGLSYDIEGSYYSGLLSSYTIDGTVEYRYLHMDSDGRYLMSTSTELVYTFMGMQRTVSDSGSYWSGNSEIQWAEAGYETIDTFDGPKECQVFSGMYPDGSVEKQWIGDGWITYRIEYSSVGTFSSESIVYTLTAVFSFEAESEVDVTAYADLGIQVEGAGTYGTGETVTLTAVADEGTDFAGWYGSDGSLLSSSPTLTIDDIYGDLEVHARNASDPDFVLSSDGSLQGLEYTDSTVWTVTGSDGEVVSTFKGDLSSYAFVNTGKYTVTAVEPGSSVYLEFTVLVDGTSVLVYDWTYDGVDYAYTLEILDSDVQYYRDYYDVSQRQQDIIGGHARDKTFVTVDDPYVKRIAEDFTVMTEGMTDLQRAEFVLAFTQCLGYQDDQMYMGYEEYWKFPLETLYDHGGDCEDTSILFCAIAEAMGYDTSLLIFTGHMAASVEVSGCDGYYFSPMYSDARYFYCETTSQDFTVGEMPASMIGYRATMVVIS